MKKTLGTLVVAVAASSLLLAGCSGSSGGDTTCKTFNGQDSKAKTETITKYLKDQGKDPANGTITVTKLSATAFCKTAGKDSSKISAIEHG